MKVSIIVPVYNEEKTISKILDKLFDVKLGVKKEIIIVNDGSKDNSKEIIRKYKNKKNLKIINKPHEGKGSAVRIGIKNASGEIVTIQDADLEYNPEDYKKLIKPILEGKEIVVYGSRFMGGRHRLNIFYFGNKFLSIFASILYLRKITDIETCYKVFKKEVVKDLNLVSKGFEIEPEITAKIFKKGIRIKEIPISYTPRFRKDGKKIGFKDGLYAIWFLVKYRFVE